MEGLGVVALLALSDTLSDWCCAIARLLTCEIAFAEREPVAAKWLGVRISSFGLLTYEAFVVDLPRPKDADLPLVHCVCDGSGVRSAGLVSDFARVEGVLLGST